MRTYKLMMLSAALAFAACNSPNETPAPAVCTSDASCDDGNACSTDTCDAASGFCAFEYNGLMAQALVAGTIEQEVTRAVEIPTTSGSASGFDYAVCPGGPNPSADPPTCVVEAVLSSGNLAWTDHGGSSFQLAGSIPFRVRNLPLQVRGLCIGNLCAIDTTVTVTVNGDGACPGGSYRNLPLDLAIDLGTPPDPHLVVTISRPRPADVDAIAAGVNFCGGVLGTLLDAVKGLLPSALEPSITGLLDQLQGEFDAGLCARAPCPAGTTEVAGTCRYADGHCRVTAPAATGLVVPAVCQVR